jgi:hypothetical protein
LLSSNSITVSIPQSSASHHQQQHRRHPVSPEITWDWTERHTSTTLDCIDSDLVNPDNSQCLDFRQHTRSSWIAAWPTQQPAAPYARSCVHSAANDSRSLLILVATGKRKNENSTKATGCPCSLTIDGQTQSHSGTHTHGRGRPCLNVREEMPPAQWHTQQPGAHIRVPVPTLRMLTLHNCAHTHTPHTPHTYSAP